MPEIGQSAAREPEWNAERLAAELRRREISRSGDDYQETVVYDTGQRVTRRRELMENSPDLQALTGARLSPVITTEVADARSGICSTSNPAGGGSWGAGGRERGYPELQPFIGELTRAMAGRSLRLTEPAIMGFLPTLAGHGNMPPWALMHPLVLWGFVVGTVFPFERCRGFRLKRGAAHFRARGELIPAADITADFDGYVACVAPHKIFRHGSPDGLPAGLEIRIFNPRLLAAAPKEKRGIPRMPSGENSMFEISLYFNDRGRRPRFGLHAYEYRQPDMNAVDRLDLAAIERLRGDGFYIRVPLELLRTLERIAPLPVGHGDCGRDLGYPALNEAYEELRTSLYQRSLRLDKLRRQCRPVIERLNRRGSWTEGPNAAGGVLKLIRRRMIKDPAGGGAWTEKVMSLAVAREEADRVRALIELPDAEKKMIGLHRAGSAIYELRPRD